MFSAGDIVEFVKGFYVESYSGSYYYDNGSDVGKLCRVINPDIGNGIMRLCVLESGKCVELDARRFTLAGVPDYEVSDVLYI